MKKNKQFENMTFEEIYSFMNSNLTNNITNVLKYCVTIHIGGSIIMVDYR